MPRSYKSNDARDQAKVALKPAAAPAIIEKVVQNAKPAAGGSFQPGDVVSFRSNSRGIVQTVTGNGVQVDFGLGSSWFTQESLTLIKAASASK